MELIIPKTMRVAPGFHKLIGPLGVRRPRELVGNSQVTGGLRFAHSVQVANT